MASKKSAHIMNRIGAGVENFFKLWPALELGPGPGPGLGPGTGLCIFQVLLPKLTASDSFKLIPDN